MEILTSIFSQKELRHRILFTLALVAIYRLGTHIPIIGIDNLEVSKQLESANLPKKCVMLFGQEGAGMSEEAVKICSVVLAISQYGSTRSMNASAAGAIAMYAWAMQHLNPSNHPKN